jgi:two-component system, OmpR family, phosphate regulon sensor histidine kinase PhoR
VNGLSDQAEPRIRALQPGPIVRAWQALLRGFKLLGVRLRASFWQIVAMAVIMATLIAVADLPWALAATAFVSFVAAASLLSRQDSEQSSEVQESSIASGRAASAMHVMAEAFPEPVILLNSRGQVLFCNASARGFFTALREGSHISSVIRTPEFLDAINAAPELGEAVTVTYAERVPVGRRMAATIAPLKWGNESGGDDILVLLRDLTEGERINQMRADFIANASHELRTPLASLRGFIETLQSSAKEDTGARERFLPIMAEQASRMTRLIDALLSLSRLEMNAHVPPSDHVDLNDVIDHAKDTLESLARDMGFTFEVIRFPRRAVVLGDRDELVQVMQNLVQNALKYGDKGGIVRMEAKHIPSLGRQVDRFAVAVIDDGPGIAPEHLPRLTERFYRVDVTSSREKGGTGLGLAIVKHILNRHRGELVIASEPGKGSTFTVMLNEARSD